MLEYIVIGALAVVVVFVLLIYQKLNSKDKSQDFANISNKLDNIDKAQSNIEKLNIKITDFSNLFSDKTRRGKMGNEYLEDIVKDCLISKHYNFEHTLSNDKRVDCLLTFSQDVSSEIICIDSKFSWENYKNYNQETDEQRRKNYLKEFEKNISKHVDDISEKYVITGETAPYAIMFVASEGVFRAIEEISDDFIKEARKKNVIITSPSTLWSFLRTYRLLMQNREMYEQTHVIQKEVDGLAQIIETFKDRFKELETRHNNNSDTIEKLKTSVNKITKASERIQNLEINENIKKRVGEK